MQPDDTDDKPFDAPVTVHSGGATRSIGSVREAYDFLSGTDWPGERGPRHRDAEDACLKVFDGHRSRVDARDGFIEAAREAGILDEADPA
ncbi:DUF982 domain-containing protein [Mesorhizobium sp. CAU 1741]|uniref:DUF982 domain-containing protein n=1 Tax=Mesorhizobium sp. CAU 1741 TaxID=3140366 RepID=UPI00325AF282